MGICWNCGKDVFLKEEETRCSSCKEIIRYWCNSCHQPFDVADKDTKKKVKECKWCWSFLCPNCNACSPNCSKYTHNKKVSEFMKPIIAIDKWNLVEETATKITAYFEDVKMGKKKTTCEFGVPKTYAKTRIKEILARMDNYKVRSIQDQEAFEQRREEVLDEDLGYEFTIKKSREDGSYGQEYRDVFNLCVCLGKLEYERKSFKNEQGLDIGYDSWTRIEESECPYLDVDELIVKECSHCKKVYPRTETYCSDCLYKRGGKKHEKDSHFELRETLSTNPTCTNLHNFKGEDDEDGEGESEGND
jgi:hypothetical protein